MFLNKILSNDEEKIKEIQNKKFKIDKNNFIFEYEKENDFETQIPKKLIEKIPKNNGNNDDGIYELELKFTYKDKIKKCDLIVDAPMISQMI